MENMLKKTILIVEDAGIDRDIVSLFLQEKYNIVSAENGLIAEQILMSGQHVALIMLDIIMPVVTGFDFLEWMQNKPEYRDIPVVFTSFEATDTNILKGLKLGVRDVIFKPYDWDEVVNRVDNLISLTESRRARGNDDSCEKGSETDCNTALIVDDFMLNRDILKETLRDTYAYLEAENGLEALEILRAHKDKICLVLLDVIMPEMDGYEMMKVASEENLLEHIPVIAVTSEDSPARHFQLLEAGVNEVVKKPFSPVVLEGRLDNLVELYRNRRRIKQAQQAQKEGAGK